MTEDERLLGVLIGHGLRDARRRVKQRQVDVAAAVGIDRASLSNIEAGKRTPSVHLLHRIVLHLGAEWRDILPSRRRLKGEREGREWRRQRLELTSGRGASSKAGPLTPS